MIACGRCGIDENDVDHRKLGCPKLPDFSVHKRQLFRRKLRRMYGESDTVSDLLVIIEELADRVEALERGPVVHGGDR